MTENIIYTVVGLLITSIIADLYDAQ